VRRTRARRTRARRTRPGLVPRAAPRGYADHLGTDAPRKPRRTPTPTPHTHSPVSGALYIIIRSLFVIYNKIWATRKITYADGFSTDRILPEQYIFSVTIARASCTQEAVPNEHFEGAGICPNRLNTLLRVALLRKA
jgi:hypothetical protein